MMPGPDQWLEHHHLEMEDEPINKWFTIYKWIYIYNWSLYYMNYMLNIGSQSFVIIIHANNHQHSYILQLGPTHVGDCWRACT